jgi:hypothetical protein
VEQVSELTGIRLDFSTPPDIGDGGEEEADGGEDFDEVEHRSDGE